MKTLLLLLLALLPLSLPAQQWDAKTGRGQGGANYPATNGPVCNTSTTAAGTCTYQDIEDVQASDKRGTRVDGHDSTDSSTPAAPDVSHVTLTKCAGSVEWCASQNNAGTVTTFPLIDASIAAEHARLAALPNCSLSGADWSQIYRDQRCPVPANSPVQLVQTVQGSSCSGATTCTITVPVQVVGDLGEIELYISGTSSAPLPTSVKDQYGVTGTLVISQDDSTQSSPNGVHALAVYSFPNMGNTGSDLFTATFAASVNSANMAAFEWQGAPTTSPTESGSGATGQGPTNCAAMSMTTTAANDVIQTLSFFPYGTTAVTGYTQDTTVTMAAAYHQTDATAQTFTIPFTGSATDAYTCIAWAIKHQ